MRGDPGSGLGISCAHVILLGTPQGGSCYEPHFATEELEVFRVLVKAEGLDSGFEPVMVCMFVSLPKCICLNPKPQCDSIWIWDLWEITRS